MPCSTVTNQNKNIISELFLKLIQIGLHTLCVAIRHDKEKAFSLYWINRSVGVSIFPNMMTWNCWTNSFCTPTVLWFIDSPKASFILKHQANLLFWILGCQNPYVVVNFFEASIASSLAFFGCRALGITLRQ